MNNKAILLLEDGTYFEGKSAGAIGTTSGEICFNTGMTGYQEVFTDPSYFGQIMVTTNAHIGNYGAKDEDQESGNIQISGLISKNFTDQHSRKLADSDLDQYFKERNVVVIYDVDTRSIVKRIRDKGAMNCVISSEEIDKSELTKVLDKTPSMEGLELASKVTTSEVYELGDNNADVKIAVLDFGTKRNILKCMTDRGAFVKVFPAKTSFEELSKMNPDGFFLSNGPGDPASMSYAVKTVKSIMETGKPTFGICLGHQLLALANGIDTYKMHHGHRGINHPVLNLESGKGEITSQNHGFGVDPESVKANVDCIVTHKNLNDESIEGIRIKGKPAFSVQYHPEAAPGPHDSRYLFDQFIELIKQNK